MSESITTVKKLTDGERFRQIGSAHGTVALALFAVFAATDAWVISTGLIISHVIATITALVVGAYLSTIFHEWGHFAGARLAKSHSPIVPKVTRSPFVFGFNFEKNSASQFISMSIGGPAGNWLLVALVFVFLPMDTPGRAALLAMVFAKAVSVCLFEVPIILSTMNGGDPKSELDTGLSNGSGDRGQVLGYIAGAVVWLLAF